MSEQRQPSLSAVLTHYNKGELIERTVASLLSQPLTWQQIIIVDDASTLPDWPVVKARLQQLPAVHIIDNTNNQGPARRLAQGLAQVSSDYVFMMDGDDVVGVQALADLFAQMQQQHADLAYGAVTKLPAHDHQHQQPQAHGQYVYSDAPLDFLLRHNHIQMCVLVKTSLLPQAGFAHVPSFIQDEYLALCLHAVATRLVYRQTPTVFVLLAPDEDQHQRAQHRLSRHLHQQHHDQFVSYQDFLQRHAQSLSLDQQRRMAMRLYGSYYKSKKYCGCATAGDHLYYLASKLWPLAIYRHTQAALSAYFRQLGEVRRL